MPSSNPIPLSRASNSSRHSSTPLWDPKTTLQIASDNCCVGQAYSKGRKCRIRLAAHNVHKGDSILQDLSTRQPDPDAIGHRLRRLAEVMLCPRWHQDQAQDMVDDWVDRIEEAYPCPTVEVETRQISLPSTPRSQSGPNRRHVTPSRSGTSTSTTIPRSSATELETLKEMVAEMQRTLLVAQRRLEELEGIASSTSTSPSVTPTISRVSTSAISSLALSRSSTISTTPSSPARESRIASPPSSPARESGVASPPSSRTCTRTHVRRRAVDDECPICREDFLLRDELVWCKSGCGRTVHRECFETWEVECRAGGRRATCAVCRSNWGSCDCDD